MSTERPELKTWNILNESLMNGDQALAEELLAAEVAGKARHQYISRIHSRINKLRAIEERKRLLGDLIR